MSDGVAEQLGALSKKKSLYIIMERNEAIKVVGFRLKVVEFCPKVVVF